MNLYVLRHGIAEYGRAGEPDSARRLTEEGIRKLQVILERARKAKVQPAVIVSSPYERARHTARLAREILGVETDVVETAVLTPEKRPEAVWGEVREFAGLESVMVVGHNPLLSSLGSWVLGAPGGTIAMKKGALAHYQVTHVASRPTAHLMWLLTAATAGA